MFIKDCYWRYIEINFKNEDEVLTEKDTLDDALFARAVKVCKDYGFVAEDTAAKLNANIKDVRTIYKFDDLNLIDWGDTHPETLGQYINDYMWK